MARKEKQDNMNFGDDSFMDIVANLVGVMIILIVLVGIQAEQAPVNIDDLIADSNTPKEPIQKKEEPKDPQFIETPIEKIEPEPKPLPKVDEEYEKLQAQFNNSMAQVMMMQESATEQASGIIQMKLVTKQREAEREQLAYLLATGEAALKERASKLDKIAQQNFEVKREEKKLEEELIETDKKLAAWELQPKEDIVKIQHFPPITSIVTDNEVHYQLKGGKLTELPYEQFVRALGRKIGPQARSVERLKEIRTRLDLGGWMVEYQLSRGNGSMEERYFSGSRLDFKAEFELLDPRLSETLEEAGQPNSRFMNRLKTVRPLRDTLTLWVYPDSFKEFSKIQKWLYPQGIMIAGRPLTMEKKITFATSGTQSNAQ
jgi:hypothetical protein